LALFVASLAAGTITSFLFPYLLLTVT